MTHPEDNADPFAALEMDIPIAKVSDIRDPDSDLSPSELPDVVVSGAVLQGSDASSDDVPNVESDFESADLDRSAVAMQTASASPSIGGTPVSSRLADVPKDLRPKLDASKTPKQTEEPTSTATTAIDDDEGNRKLALLAVPVALCLLGGGWIASRALGGGNNETNAAAELTNDQSTTVLDPIGSEPATENDLAFTNDTTSTDDTASSELDDWLIDASDLPEGNPEDQLSLQIETESTAERGGATATVRRDGKLYFEGAFRSQDEANRYLTRAKSVFGEDSVVEAYSIDPDAPPPAANDVVLDKPVLFETGSAQIHPDYVPYLEACGDVLKLNPSITMSVAAYTDPVGDEDFNLELSQKRAQAIVDFYLELEVDESQLVGYGLGETGSFSEDSSTESSAENRRAMLQLLDVMGDG